MIERLRNRSKAWAELHEIASHIGVFPLDCCMIDSRLEAEAADALEHQHYADIEHEHLGCPVAETGIYAPRSAARATEPVMWREGDVSDLGQWVYADTAEERDEPLDRWQPLYEAPQPAPPPMGKEEWEASIERMREAIQGPRSAIGRRECPYCTSENEAIRSTYYDQTCEGCVKRMG